MKLYGGRKNSSYYNQIHKLVPSYKWECNYHFILKQLKLFGCNLPCNVRTFLDWLQSYNWSGIPPISNSKLLSQSLFCHFFSKKFFLDSPGSCYGTKELRCCYYTLFLSNNPSLEWLENFQNNSAKLYLPISFFGIGNWAYSYLGWWYMEYFPVIWNYPHMPSKQKGHSQSTLGLRSLLLFLLLSGYQRERARSATNR